MTAKSFMNTGMNVKKNVLNALWECIIHFLKMHVSFAQLAKLSTVFQENAKIFVLKNQNTTKKPKNASALMKDITGLEIIVLIAQMIKKNIGWMSLIAVQNAHKILTSICNSENAPNVLKDLYTILLKNCVQRRL